MSDNDKNPKKRGSDAIDSKTSKKTKTQESSNQNPNDIDYSQYYNYYYQGYNQGQYGYPDYYSSYNPQYWSQYYGQQQQQTQNGSEYYPYYSNTYQSTVDTKAFENVPKRTIYRKAAGVTWDDPTLADWPENDWRIFVGNLGNDVTDDVLKEAFSKYKSLAKVKVIRDKYQKSRGFGFLSFLDPKDFVAALKEMNGKYVGSRPCILKKSDWKSRNDYDKMRPKRKKQKDST